MLAQIISVFFWRLAVVLCLTCASAAQAGTLFRAYLSGVGNDSNPCTLPQPCRLLPAALAAVQAGGDIWMIDSANYNTGRVTVSQSVTILAIPGALGSVTASNDAAIYVTGTGINVTLRNLLVRNLTGSTNSGVVVVGQNNRLIVEGSKVDGLATGINVASPGSFVEIFHSAFRGNGQAIQVTGSAATPALGVVDGCTISDGVNGIFGQWAKILASHNNISSMNNGSVDRYGIWANDGATIGIVGNTITQNGFAVIAEATDSSIQTAYSVPFPGVDVKTNSIFNNTFDFYDPHAVLAGLQQR